MCDAQRVTAAGRGVCLTPGYGMAVGPFDPMGAAAQGAAWREVTTWSHRARGRCEVLFSLRFAVFSRLSEVALTDADALAEPELRRSHSAPGGGLLRAEVAVTRASARASKTILVGPGGIDVFGSSVRVTLLAPPAMRSAEHATYPVAASGWGALEEIWVPVLGEDGAALRPRAVVHTYCAAGVSSPVPPSATRYTVLGNPAPSVTLSAGTVAVSVASSGLVGGYRRLTTSADAVVAWEVEP